MTSPTYPTASGKDRPVTDEDYIALLLALEDRSLPEPPEQLITATMTMVPQSQSAPPSLSAITSVQTLLQSLHQLDRLDSTALTSCQQIYSARIRRDEAMQARRQFLDSKISALRAQKDEDTRQRRAQEDLALQRYFEDIDREEFTVRKLLKKRKRGLHFDTQPTEVSMEQGRQSTQRTPVTVLTNIDPSDDLISWDGAISERGTSRYDIHPPQTTKVNTKEYSSPRLVKSPANGAISTDHEAAFLEEHEPSPPSNL